MAFWLEKLTEKKARWLFGFDPKPRMAWSFGFWLFKLKSTGSRHPWPASNRLGVGLEARTPGVTICEKCWIFSKKLGFFTTFCKNILKTLRVRRNA